MAAWGGSRVSASRATASAVREGGGGTTDAVGHQLADLPGVEQSCPPVETDPPDGEGPAEDLGEGGDGPVTVAQEEQGEGVEQRGGRGLAEVVDREGGVATGAEE